MPGRPSHVWYALFIAAIVTVLFFLAMKKAARAAPYIPPSCIVLAAREGQPIETEAEIRKARLKLWFMKRDDPLVRDCRAAIRRYKAEMER